jgi:D-alanyl-D-alanine carboxypeptidase (penicillin-binding protein 5/6)
MVGWRVVFAALGALLTGASPAVPASPSAAAPFVRCPTVAVARPRVPSPPVHDPSQPTLGGAALSSTGLVVPAGVPAPPAVTAASWLVADLDTGEVLASCGPHQYHPPASVQKLLLCATMLPKLDPARVVTITPGDIAIQPGSSAVGLVLGGHYSVGTLWLGLLLESGNDAANTLARLGGGDAGLAGGLAAMNAEAQRLGALDTHAVTSSGLNAPGQFTSVYDLALIARADFARADFRKYDATLRAQMPAQPPKDPHGYQIQNENQLLTKYPGALGGKTGFTDQARHTYVGAAQRNGRRLVVTLLDAEAHPIRGWQQGAKLLDWAFTLPTTAGVGHLVTPEEVAQLRNPPAPKPKPSSSPARPALAHSSTGTGAIGVVVAVSAALVLLIIAVIVGVGRRPRPGAPGGTR